MIRIYLIGFIGLLIFSPELYAQSFPNCEHEFTPVDASYAFVRVRQPVQLPLEKLSIGEIKVTRLPVFDEGNNEEDNVLYRLANRIHILTKEPIVFQQLLFETAEEFDPRSTQETQRLLRAQGSFFDADIRPYRVCGGKVDLEVITRDSWSLTPNLGFDRAGGENNFSMGFRDTNILGLGNQLSIAASQDIDRQSTELIYEDNNVFGTRLRNFTEFIDSDDGFTHIVELGLPFFELDSKNAWRVRLENDERIDEIFFRGEEVAGAVHALERYSLEYGFSGGLVDGYSRRWLIGYGYRSDEFSVSDALPAPADFPSNRELSFPYIKYESIEDNFVTAINLEQIYLTEDLHIGSRLNFSVGIAAEEFGSDQNRLVLHGGYADTLFYDGRQLSQHEVHFDGFWNEANGQLEDFVLNYEARYFRRQSGPFGLFVNFKAAYSENLNSNRQIVVGGIAGARAFDNRFQAGDRSVVLSVEERVYSNLHLFNLVRVGAAVFADIGRAWEPGIDDGIVDDYLSNVGIGLRLGSSKSASSRVAHIDIAIPISNRDDPDVGDFQISIEVKESF
ncbi:MAG: hypothetical protein ACI81O_001015 [Cyclobacteriaceae bacterium]|jgi:hypothetical protein